MIGKDGGLFYLGCSECGKHEKDLFYEFSDVLEYIKQNGWIRQKSKLFDFEWEDICPECQNKLNSM